MPYNPSLDRCNDGPPDYSMVTTRGEARRHDYIQLCTKYYNTAIINKAKASMRYNVPLIPIGVGLDENEIRSLRELGLTPADVALDASHMIIRAVSQLYLFACKFAETDIRY